MDMIHDKCIFQKIGFLLNFSNICCWYEGCSNMNASSFITFVTYMLRQNGIRF